ncbi:MAG TPA: site-specific DNA-methyltransferase [Rudaea sp.]|nr:site-specific DNA-methyltransferase [Rudaea sp.]
MPVLNWIGKDAVVAHDTQVPFRLLHDVPELACPPQAAEHASFPPLPLAGEGRGEGGDNSTGNLIVEGDNLLALKALLPHYGGQVKCIYIDPPYNTGNEGWVYNDNVNSPQMREWLGKVVGKEAEDLTRHDKWLCMMYPRLKLLKRFLREDGFLFVSLDDNECSSLLQILIELFGEQNFVAQIIVEANRRGQTYKQISKTHEYILCFSRTPIARLSEIQTGGDNLDKRDEFGGYSARELRNRNPKFGRYNRPNLFYPIYVDLNSGDSEQQYAISTVREPNFIEVLPLNSEGKESCWRWGQPTLAKACAEGKRIVYGSRTRAGEWRVFEKYRKESVKAKTIWSETEFISEQGTYVLTEMGMAEQFQFPKPPDLIRRCIELATSNGDLILDSFAGSGTTGHAVLKANAEDGGNRRFILVEMDEKIARGVTAERMKRVAQGYRKGNNTLTPTPLPQAGEGRDWVAGLGGGFRYATLGKPLFAANGHINPEVTFSELARFVWFMETGVPWADEPPSPQPSPASGRGGKALSPLLGVHAGRAVYLLYNGILKDKSAGGGNALTSPLLAELPPHDGPKTIYGTRCLIKPERLRALRIAFKQLPYELKVAR